MPIKRSIALQPLSRQHHNGLLFCLLLGKGVKRQASLIDMQLFIRQFKAQDLNTHFATEEELLLPLGTQYNELQPLLDQMKSEHLQLAEVIDDIEHLPAYESILKLSKLLEKHIRFEEQILFIEIEKVISASLLQEIQTVLHHDEHKTNCMNYPVKFWEG